MDTSKSQDKKCPLRNYGVIVVVRAAGDEPVLLKVIDDYGDLIELEGSQPGNTIRFPRHHVYTYNQEGFAALQRAYSNGDATELASIWGRSDKYEYNEEE